MTFTKMSESSCFMLCLHYFPFFLSMCLVCCPPLHCDAVDSCLQEGAAIRSNNNGNGSNTIVSPSGIFELGFFTPEGSSHISGYLGIWYYQSEPKTVVWVANREKPVWELNGFLVIEGGNAKLVGMTGTTYWSTDSATSKPVPFSNSSYKFHDHPTFSNKSAFVVSARICLDDKGNLYLEDRRYPGKILWQSFDHPCDTVLPGMSVNLADLNLTSWLSLSDPAPGNFMLQIKWQTESGVTQPQVVLAIEKTGVDYWKSGLTPFMPAELNDLLTDNYQNTTTRLVMSFSGQVEVWKLEGENWSLIWSEPKDKCSFDNVCGDFGSCNSNNRFMCKCLPGFKPRKSLQWNSGNFSGGCSPKSESCYRNFTEDVFLKLPMMKLAAAQPSDLIANEDCETVCLGDCHCVAYSCGASGCSGAEKDCMLWRKSIDLTDLQEDYAQGYAIYVRTSRSDTALTARDCNPCGTYILPYPLSTGPNCGDTSYSYFHCNTTSGQVSLSTSSGTFSVTLIDPDEQMFGIRAENISYCDSRFLDSLVQSPTKSLPFPFSVKNCSVVKDQSFTEVEQSHVEVQMNWKPPPEPACNSSSDCLDWPHTTCEAEKGGKKRCTCRSYFHWDGQRLKCTRVRFPVKVVVPLCAGALAVIFSSVILFIRLTRKRRAAKRHGFLQSSDDAEDIDVPFFDWGSIQAATNNFADANKLGAGGFGAVYKGKLLNGKEIAVKRLSSVSVQGVEEFRTEVMLIAKLQHRNLVRLLGYCAKSDEKILLYEFMPNGSLDSCIFEKRSVSLDWEKRCDIMVGIARGLMYLHQDSRLRIIHRDLKPSNILLDEELNPKISDFGIARTVGGKETQGSTVRVVGTYGYMSPEYVYEGLFSVKSDVFSFGVVVLETISGRRNSRQFLIEYGLSLLGHAWRLWSEDRGLDLMDQTLMESCNQSEVLKCIHVGLLCVQEDPSDRPTMSGVILMLSSENANLSPPKQPAFSTRQQLSETGTSSSMKDMSAGDVMTLSTVGR